LALNKYSPLNKKPVLIFSRQAFLLINSQFNSRKKINKYCISNSDSHKNFIAYILKSKAFKKNYKN